MSSTAPMPVLPAPQVQARRPDLVDFLLDADPTGADALIEAGELYGDDAGRELADLEAGRHPVQRSRKP
jgi:hypothetical protein